MRRELSSCRRPAVPTLGSRKKGGRPVVDRSGSNPTPHPLPAPELLDARSKKEPEPGLMYVTDVSMQATDTFEIRSQDDAESRFDLSTPLKVDTLRVLDRSCK